MAVGVNREESATMIIMRAKEYSQLIRQEADRLLSHTKLLDLLAQFGDVDLGGSYAYDLMVDRDLDFGVSVKEITPDFRAKVVSIFAKQPWSYSVNMTDRVNFEPLSNLSAPRGLFIGLTVPFPVERWNIDIWFIVSDTLPKDTLAELIKKATDEQKQTILEIKYELMNSGKKQKGVTSAEIYKAVLLRGIGSAEDF